MPTTSDHSASGAAGFPQSDRLSGLRQVLALAGLVIALSASAALVWASVMPTALPGCGSSLQGTSLAPPGWKGCAEAGASSWGRLMLGAWSVSTALVGCGTYVGALVLVLGATSLRVLRWMARILIATSIFFVVIAATQRFWCPYCATAHAGVLVMWLAIESAPRGARNAPVGRGWIAAISTALLIILGGGVAERHFVQKKQQVAASDAAKEVAQQVATPQASSVKRLPEPAAYEVARFTGRYHLGSEKPRVRIVVISDFQCADCQKLDRELVDLADKPNVSVSMKHFPFCRDCNQNVPQTLHANACWAARAAEAAGMVGGTLGFWEMHHWLFSRGGGFTEAELRSRVAAQGLAVDQFMAAFTGRESLDRVKTDVAEAMKLGISRTPMVFVNGVECAGWENPGTVTRIVNAVLEATASAEWDPQWVDQPPLAKEKYLAMWRAAPIEMREQAARQRGVGLAKITLVGDYQESGTREVQAIISEVLSEDWSASFAFHHYPADPACNPAIPRKMNDRACDLAKGVIAAGLAGGDAAYWKAHDQAMVLGGMTPIPADVVAPIANAATIDVARLRDAQISKAADQRLAESVRATSAQSITELPTLFINGKRLTRWRGGVDSKELMREVIIEACGGVKRDPQPTPTP